MVLAVYTPLFLVGLCAAVYSSSLDPDACFNKPVDTIPSGHLYWQKPKPLVLGHHGNPSQYQENTVDGFKSLLDTNADGIEFDTFLTKDEKLVVIHYNNTETLTGESHIIWNTTYDVLKNLILPTSLEYGSNVFKFDEPRKIPLLEEVLDAVKGTELVMFLNIKPGYTRNVLESTKVGQKVAELVIEKGVQNQVLFCSFDPFKIRAVKQKDPSLVVGMFYKTAMWTEDVANDMKKVLVDLPGMSDCVQKDDNGTNFMNFLFKSGAMLKSTNASFLLMDHNIFDNPKYSNDTFKVFSDNYGSNFSFGAFVIDHLKLTDSQREHEEKKLDLLLENNVKSLATDDVPKLLRKLNRPITRGAAPAVRHSSAISATPMGPGVLVVILILQVQRCLCCTWPY